MGSFEDPRLQKKPKPWIETPLIESQALSRAAGCRVFLKLENLQPSGSFKSRAIGNLILSHVANPANQGKRLHFFIPSGGNAGLAAVTAARALSYPCTVVVPRSTTSIMIDLLADAGANVIVHGESISDAGKYMREVVMTELGIEGDGEDDTVAIELHPFDHEKIWEGVSTIVDELAYQLPARDDEDIAHVSSSSPLPVDAIVCSVGGGGLMNGIILGIERQSRMGWILREPSHKQKDIHILATETHGTASLAFAVARKSLVSLPEITSLATSLGAVRVAPRTLQNTLFPPRGIKVHSVVLHDAEAAKGVLRLVDEQKLLVELACGVCVEAIMGIGSGRPPINNKLKTGHPTIGNGCIPITNGHGQEDVETSVLSRLAQLIPGFGPKSRVVIIVCGGNNVSVDMATEWRQRIGDGWGNDETLSAQVTQA